MTTVACTIVSANYLSYAATLRDSLRATDPRLTFKVLLVDEPSDVAQAAVDQLQLDVLWLRSLDLPSWRYLAFVYSILELNTIVKPAFLRHLFELGFDRVIYCDPDTFFFSSLLRALAPAEGRSIALTPHLLTDQGSIIEEVPLLQMGVFNLGFIALSKGEQTLRFLSWWSSRCMSGGFDDVASGHYVDQKWVDFVPALFSDNYILRSPALNVAYWNIHERVLRKSDNIVFVADEPLVFFHFSGIARTTKELTRHKIVLSSESTRIAESLADTYRRAIESRGHSELRTIPYSFDHFDDGSPILPIHRVALFHFGDQKSTGDPFCVSGSFAQQLRRSALWPRSGRAATFRPEHSGSTTRANQERRISCLLTLLARIMGPSRYWYLCKYLSLCISPVLQCREIMGLLGHSTKDLRGN